MFIICGVLLLHIFKYEEGEHHKPFYYCVWFVHLNFSPGSCNWESFYYFIFDLFPPPTNHCIVQRVISCRVVSFDMYVCMYVCVWSLAFSQCRSQIPAHEKSASCGNMWWVNDTKLVLFFKSVIKCFINLKM